MAEVCIFGEVLFDCFPGGERVLGGAPFNVAWHLQAFGEAPLLVSRVGRDADGDAILLAMHRWGMRTDGVGRDDYLPTGRVEVSFDNGEPAYDIVHPAAWDAIIPPAGVQIDMLYHGSLALRDEQSRSALMALKAGPSQVFVDINLRPPWWQPALARELLAGADWVKLNADEMEVLGGSMDAPGLITAHGLRGLIVTRGSAGAEVHTPGCDPVCGAPEQGVQVVDTVGAGDAFASVMLLGLLRGWKPATSVVRAQGFASRIVGQRGATVSDADFYRDIMQAWQAEDLSATDEEGGDV